MEKMRRRLMANDHQWGDPPPSPGDRSTRDLSTSRATASQSSASSSNTRGTSTSPSSAEQGSSDDDVPMGLTRRRPTKPSQESRRAFITSEGWSLENLLNNNKFRQANRISSLGSAEEVSRAIERHEQDGIPLIIDGWHKRNDWPADIFNIQWLLKHHGDDTLVTRNMHNRTDKTVSMTDFVDQCRTKSPYATPDETERLYGKDAECPHEWRNWLCDGGTLPTELLPSGTNDLLQHLPDEKKVESLMCYLGIGDTFTPCHKDLCASSGQNIMCYTEDGGSSFWFMTTSSDAPLAAEYFQQELGQELDWETHVTSVEELAKAPFDVYVLEQKLGDLVLVPPRSCHQVVNHGGLTVKMSWSRMTLKGLRTALHYELPIYQRVCRPELYRVKSVLYRTLLHHTAELEGALVLSDSVVSSSQPNESLVDYPDSSGSSRSSTPRSPSPEPVPAVDVRKRSDDLMALVELFDGVLCEEYTSNRAELSHVLSSGAGWGADSRGSSVNVRLLLRPPRASTSRTGEGKAAPASQNFACDFCGADIFQSFFECDKCTGSEKVTIGDGLLVCASCYVDGRTCRCGSMNPVQYRPYGVLLAQRNKAVKVLDQVVKSIGMRNSKLKALTESDIIEQEDHVRIFDAAIALLQLRTTLREAPDRHCRMNQHVISAIHAVRCNSCRSNKCYRHHLNGGMHSAEIILAHGNEKGNHTAWHNSHMKARVDFLQHYAATLEAEKTGAPSSHGHRLAIMANRYRWCLPINPAFTRLGFYDEDISEPARNPAQLENSSKETSQTPESIIAEQAVENQLFSNSPLTEPEDTSDVAIPELVLCPPKPVARKHTTLRKRRADELSNPPPPPPSLAPHPPKPRAVASVVITKRRDWNTLRKGYTPILEVEVWNPNKKARTEASADRRQSVAASNGPSKPRVSQPPNEDDGDRYVDEDYAQSLAAALNSSSHANATQRERSILRPRQRTGPPQPSDAPLKAPASETPARIDHTMSALPALTMERRRISTRSSTRDIDDRPSKRRRTEATRSRAPPNRRPQRVDSDDDNESDVEIIEYRAAPPQASTSQVPSRAADADASKSQPSVPIDSRQSPEVVLVDEQTIARIAETLGASAGSIRLGPPRKVGPQRVSTSSASAAKGKGGKASNLSKRRDSGRAKKPEARVSPGPSTLQDRVPHSQIDTEPGDLLVLEIPQDTTSTALALPIASATTETRQPVVARSSNTAVPKVPRAKIPRKGKGQLPSDSTPAVVPEPSEPMDRHANAVSSSRAHDLEPPDLLKSITKQFEGLQVEIGNMKREAAREAEHLKGEVATLKETVEILKSDNKTLRNLVHASEDTKLRLQKEGADLREKVQAFITANQLTTSSQEKTLGDYVRKEDLNPLTMKCIQEFFRSQPPAERAALIQSGTGQQPCGNVAEGTPQDQPIPMFFSGGPMRIVHEHHQVVSPYNDRPNRSFRGGRGFLNSGRGRGGPNFGGHHLRHNSEQGQRWTPHPRWMTTRHVPFTEADTHTSTPTTLAGLAQHGRPGGMDSTNKEARGINFHARDGLDLSQYRHSRWDTLQNPKVAQSEERNPSYTVTPSRDEGDDGTGREHDFDAPSRQYNSDGEDYASQPFDQPSAPHSSSMNRSSTRHFESLSRSHPSTPSQSYSMSATPRPSPSRSYSRSESPSETSPSRSRSADVDGDRSARDSISLDRSPSQFTMIRSPYSDGAKTPPRPAPWCEERSTFGTSPGSGNHTSYEGNGARGRRI